MARTIPSWAAVTGLTASAIAVVAVLALQANGAAPRHLAEDRKAKAPQAPSADAEPRPPKSPAVPADSGQGKRIIYSLGQDRAWLVDARGAKAGTFPVWPGTLDPGLGNHQVTIRRPSTTGSDGVPIEHVIYFGTSGDVSIAFSAAVDGSSPKPVPGKQTGGIRLRSDDGTALWNFSAVGTPVVVVR
ncbi:L,D-transpeptidase [Streptomyces sp. NPDC004647]|uniref:L,D-transpeptidase n=1 Tax=Streptomyces sp. NPDC004647 TaxID=3154671 RepID=UPI0033BC1E9D